MNCPADIKDEKEGSMKRTSKLDDAICRGNHIWIVVNAYRGRILLPKKHSAFQRYAFEAS